MTDRERLGPGSSLDDTIDAVLREVANADPPTGLGGKVLARVGRLDAAHLEPGAPAPPRRWMLPALGAAAAVAILAVAIGLLSVRGPAPSESRAPAIRARAPGASQRLPGPVETAVAALAPPTAQVQPAETRRPGPAQDGGTPRGARSVRAGSRRVMAASLAPGDVEGLSTGTGVAQEEPEAVTPIAIPPLPTPPPASFETIEITPIVVPAIEIPLIEIKPLDVGTAPRPAEPGKSQQH